ncbi:MAG: hypothetical protein JXP73_16030 [Deltaproteobacteria bacterium]|nr:hypothetical protein [Deltaproteobacteria bacterium]
MGLFGNSHYDRLKKLADASPTVAPHSVSPAGLLDVVKTQTEIAGAINAATQAGKISAAEQQELLGILRAKMPMGRR